MKRILTVLTVAVLMAVMLVAGAGYAFAYANFDNNGNAANAPGQQNAQDNCSDTIGKQSDKDVSAGGGPKEGVPAPTNCDKFYNP